MALIRGEDVAEVFTDEGVSGSVQLAKRDAGSRLVAVLQPGDVVVMTQLDRAFRDTVDALTMAEAWKAQGVKMIVSRGSARHHSLNSFGGCVEN